MTHNIEKSSEEDEEDLKLLRTASVPEFRHWHNFVKNSKYETLRSVCS